MSHLCGSLCAVATLVLAGIASFVPQRTIVPTEKRSLTTTPEPEYRFVDDGPSDVPFKKADWASFAADFRRVQFISPSRLEYDLIVTPIVGMPATVEAQNKVARQMMVTAEPTDVLTAEFEHLHLPYTKGPDCTLDHPKAQELADYAAEIRGLSPLENFVVEGHRSRSWFVTYCARPAALPALTQMLPVEDAPTRSTLVEMLSRLSSPKAAEALVQRAVFDVDQTVRMEAVYALKHRPPAQYRDRLIAMLDHPWDAAVLRAAEAIANLPGAISRDDLKGTAHRVQPRNRVEVGVGDSKTTHVREMVRMIHVNNCLLCHPASYGGSIRAPLPAPYTPPTARRYYNRPSDQVVRADITYLRQDFSAMLPLSAHEASEAAVSRGQPYRYDFVVRTRPLFRDEMAAPMPAGGDKIRTQALTFARKHLPR